MSAETLLHLCATPASQRNDPPYEGGCRVIRLYRHLPQRIQFAKLHGVKIPAGSRWNHAGISDGFILRLFAEKSHPETANGNTYDNAMTKIFCIGKTECIYRNKSNTSSKINAIIERYILFRSSVSIYQRMTVHILYMLFHFVTAIRYASVRFVLMAI